MKKLLYLGGYYPREPSPSGAIVDRHLRLLRAEGFQTVIACPSLQPDRLDALPPSSSDCSEFISLSGKPFGCIPLRFSISATVWLRFDHWHRQLSNHLGRLSQPLHLLTVYDSYIAVFAAYLARTYNLCLHLLIHDDNTNQSSMTQADRFLHKNSSFVFAQASHVWAVSQQLLDIYSSQIRSSASVLLPIPEPESSIQPKTVDCSHHTRNTFVYAGSIYPGLVGVLQKIANQLPLPFRLVVISKDAGHVRELLNEAAKQDIQVLPYFESHSDLMDFLLGNCYAILVPYPIENENCWQLSCFPSKFVDYCKLHLPILILCSPQSALAHWCSMNKWKAIATCYEEFLALVQNTTDATTYNFFCSQSASLAQTQFNPSVIHRQFLNELLSSDSSSADVV